VACCNAATKGYRRGAGCQNGRTGDLFPKIRFARDDGEQGLNEISDAAMAV
jgi:hypothetical protein